MRSKRVVDLAIALPLAAFTFPLVSALICLATLDTGANGLFRQHRVGRGGAVFSVYKIRTMRKSLDDSTVTTAVDNRVTRLGSWMRSKKLDELPQLWNVIRGDMSLVGPRPDVPGYADKLVGDDRMLLDLRPGITGPATLLFRDEESLLASYSDPIEANDTILWPAKVRINRAYQSHSTMLDQLRLLRLTVVGDSDALSDLIGRWDPSFGSDPVVPLFGTDRRATIDPFDERRAS